MNPNLNKSYISTFKDYLIEIDNIKEIVDNGLWRRAGGDCICPVCGKAFNRHKNINGYEWLTAICNGLIVKL